MGEITVNKMKELQRKDLKYIWHPCSQMKDYETFVGRGGPIDFNGFQRNVSGTKHPLNLSIIL